MIDAALIEDYERFCNRWKGYLPDPTLALDGSWPSIGILDLMTQHLRLPENPPDPAQLDLLQGVALYLAVYIHHTWALCGIDAEVTKTEDGVFLRVLTKPADAPGAGRDGYFLNMELAVASLLTLLPTPLPVLFGHTPTITRESPVLSWFALGALLGLNPLYEGTERDAYRDMFFQSMDKILIEASRQAATRYTALYPDEMLGQLGEMYLDDLIYPPFLMDESTPGINASKGLLDFFKEYKIGIPKIRILAENLMLSSDPQIASLGIIFYAALAEDLPSPKHIAAAQYRVIEVGDLRPAVLNVRKQLGMRNDWLTVKDFAQEDAKRFEIEQTLGLLPGLVISAKRLRQLPEQSKFQQAAQRIAERKYDEAMEILDDLIEDDPGDTEVRIQRVFLDFMKNSPENAETALKELSSEPDAERDHRVLDLLGFFELARGNPQAAVKHFRAALLSAGKNPVAQAQCANNCAWAHMLLGEWDQAIYMCDLGLRSARYLTPLLLNKGSCYYKLGNLEGKKMVDRQLLELAPTDGRVVTRLVLNEHMDRIERQMSPQHVANS